MTVKTPYHFIPLSKWVYVPEWTNRVSHDIPFKDGMRATIKYSLVNSTHLLIANEHDKTSKPAKVSWSKDLHGRPIIPGTSIKGMIRSVLEVITFSKLFNVQDIKLSYREFNNNVYKKLLKDTEAQSAWLRYNKKAKYWEVKRVLHSKIFNDILNGMINIESKKINHKLTAITKYNKVPLSGFFDVNIKDFKVDGSGTTKGNIVFTDPRIRAEQDISLQFDYFFHDGDQNFEKIEQQDMVTEFFASHDESLVKYLKKNQHKELGIPVFLRVDENNKIDIRAIGTSKMPRIQYKHSIHELIKNHQKEFANENLLDFTEALLGVIRENQISLKSRVSFSDALILKKENFNGFEMIKANKILMTPKASYLAGYIQKQNHSDVFNGYNDERNTIKGIKAYPRHESFNKTNQLLTGRDCNKDMVSQLEMLKEGNRFNGEIHLHNINEIELSAIIWCLTLGQGQKGSQYFHGLGHAKPYGAGNVQIKVEHLEVMPNNPSEKKLNEENPELEKYITKFEEHMKGVHFSSKWFESPQIKHLLSFSKININKDLEYMTLDEYSENSKQILKDWVDTDTQEILSRDEGSVPKEFNYDAANSVGLGKLSHIINNNG